MSLANHYDKTATVERLATVTGNKKSYAAHLASVLCHIQPISDETSQDIPGGFGRDLLMLSAIVDVAEGDKVVIDSEEYRVMGTESLNFGQSPHRETRIRIFKSS